MVMYFCTMLLCCSATTLHGADAPPPAPKKLLTMRTEPIGLPNIGNSCFMNSTLQALMSLELLVLGLINTSKDDIEDYYTTKASQTLRAKESVGGLKNYYEYVRFYGHFYTFAKEYQTYTGPILNGSHTHNFFKDFETHFKLGHQDDAAIFLENALRALTAASEYKDKLFTWDILEVTWSAKIKGHVFQRPLKETPLMFDPSGQESLGFFKQRFIPHDAPPQPVGRPKFLIEQPTIYLPIRSVDLFLFPFPVELILPKEYLKYQNGDIPYSLRSIILKDTGTRYQGHYKALVRYGDAWWEANDSQITRVNLKEIEEFSKTGLWQDNFVARALFYECIDLDRLIEDSRLKKMQEVVEKARDRDRLKKFQRDLNLITTLATLRNEGAAA